MGVARLQHPAPERVEVVNLQPFISVNTLLRVPDDEQCVVPKPPGAILREQPDKLLLRAVRVLKFIHEDPLAFLPQGLQGLRVALYKGQGLLRRIPWNRIGIAAVLRTDLFRKIRDCTDVKLRKLRKEGFQALLLLRLRGGNLAFQLLHELRAKLPGRLLRISDHNETIRTGPFVKLTQNSPGQAGGFACARACLHEQIVICPGNIRTLAVFIP